MTNRKSTSLIVIHCSATFAHQNVTAEEIRRWHVEDRGWSDIGYNAVIERNGDIRMGRQEGAIGAHAKGFNSESIAVCMVGGLDEKGRPENNFTKDQFESLAIYVRGLTHLYPDAEVIGHRDLPRVKKDCPCFDVRKWWDHL